MPRRGAGGRAPHAPMPITTMRAHRLQPKLPQTNPRNPPAPSHRCGKPQPRRPKQHRHTSSDAHTGAHVALRERPAGKAGTRHGWRARQPSRGHRPHHLLTSSRTDRPGVGGGNHANQPDPESNASEPPGLAAIGLTKHGAHKVRAREEATGKSGRTRPGNGGRSRS